MGGLDEFPVTTRAFLKTYRWRRIDPVPWAPLRKPPAEARVGLVSTAGLVLPDQEPFRDDVQGGDASFRVIGGDAGVASLIDTHRSRSFDHAGIREDANLAFPLDRLRELAAAGTIGSANRRHLSFMGSITAPGRLTKESAPAAAELFVEDQVDVALLVPV
jgi:D-proline reductase (dithiol) PrdB